MFTVVCCKMCVHTLQSLYSYQTSFREWPLSCKNRDGSGQAGKDTGRHGVFTVVCFKMWVHPVQSLYSYQTSFREWPLSCKNRDGSGQAGKDTGRHGVFTVVCFKMCVHPVQSLYSYQTSFREWPLSCKKQRWIRTSREGYRTSWCVHCSVLQNVSSQAYKIMTMV